MIEVDIDALTEHDLSNRIFFRLYQADNVMHKTATRAMLEFGVTSQQWAVLGALTHPEVKQGINVGELAELLKVSRQNLSGVINRLQARNLIERVADSRDARSRRVRLTQTGAELWEAMQESINKYFGDVMQGFSREERANTLALLTKLLDAMESL